MFTELPKLVIQYIKLSMSKFENSYLALPNILYSKESAAKFNRCELLLWNEDLAKQIGLTEILDSHNLPKLISFLSGDKSLADQKTIALAYAGHQFGYFTNQLGDGRALLLGEIEKDNQKIEIQLKGSGPTIYSRRGDGKSPLGPAIREFLISEAMHYLKIPTTRSLSVLSTNEIVYREIELKGGILARVAKCHVRVGTFEFLAVRNAQEEIKKLLDFVIVKLKVPINTNIEIPKEHQHTFGPYSTKAFSLFEYVIEKQAQLVAKWMSVGFIHGVMNTDNMLLSGETIDYGPCAYLDEFNPAQVFSSIDTQGRYAYQNQPSIAKWNLARLADALLVIFPNNKNSAIEIFTQLLSKFDLIFHDAYFSEMKMKLGFQNTDSVDDTFVMEYLGLLYEYKFDYTSSNRGLSNYVSMSKEVLRENLLQTQGEHQDLIKWIMQWHEKVKSQNDVTKQKSTVQEALEEKIIEQMNSLNPIYIPRNHLVEQAIGKAYEGDISSAIELWNILKNPYVAQQGKDLFKFPAKSDEKVTTTFCGT